MNDVREDMQRKPAELEQEADRARAAVEHTLEALEHKFSPGQLLDQVLHLAKSNGSDFGKNLTTQARNNPVPLLLTGVGITWLMSASNRPPENAGSSAGPSAGQRVSSAASGAKSAASGAADRTRATARSTSDSISGTAQSAREAMSSATDSTRSALGNTRAALGSAAGSTRQTAANLANASRGSARNIADGYDYLRREQPLVLGALAVAAGAALGALLPSTRREDEWIGERSEQATERLKQEGREKAQEAKSAAADAAEAARQAAEPNRPDTRAGGQV